MLCWGQSNKQFVQNKIQKDLRLTGQLTGHSFGEPSYFFICIHPLHYFLKTVIHVLWLHVVLYYVLRCYIFTILFLMYRNCHYHLIWLLCKMITMIINENMTTISMVQVVWTLVTLLPLYHQNTLVKGQRYLSNYVQRSL